MTLAEAENWVEIHRLEHWLALKAGDLASALAALCDVHTMRAEASRIRRLNKP